MPNKKLDNETADQLLQLLGTDDEFRKKFQRDPLEALKTIGYQPEDSTEAAPFAGCRITKLADPEDILSAKAALKAELVGGLAYTSPNLEAGAKAFKLK